MNSSSFQVLHKASQKILSTQCRVADTSWSRMVGLLNRDSLNPEESLLIVPCFHVHTFFMRFPIDTVFLGSDDRIVGIESLTPWHISRLYRKAKKVLEMPAGSSSRHALKIGDQLEFICCS